MTETVRRYRVGIDLKKYARRYILGCSVSALTTAVLCIAIFVCIYNAGITETKSYYENIIAGLNETIETNLANYEREKQVLIDRHKAEIDAMTTKLDEVYMDLDAAVETIDTIMEDGHEEFKVLQKYWYVFRDAPADTGLTVAALLFSDQMCKEWDVNPDWMWSIYWLESKYNTVIDNGSGSGASGLGQVMPRTGKSMWENILGHGAGTYNHKMAYDPFVNIEITTALIGRNLNKGSMYDSINLYSGGGGQGYYNTVVSTAKNRGITLNESNAHYPT